MKRTIQVAVVCVAVMFAVGQVQAVVITHGYLTSDDSTNYITDTVTNRQYTRFDVFDLTVAETQAAIGSGGAFDGWSIATSVEADDFIRKILGVSSAPTDGTVPYGTLGGTIAGWADGDFGDSSLVNYDYFAYFSTGGDPLNPIGLVEIQDSSNEIRQYDLWGTVAKLDSNPQNVPVNLILFRDQVPSDVEVTPEPTSLAIFGIGALCMGAGAARRRRKEQQAGD